MSETVDVHHEAIDAVKQNVERELHKKSVRRLNHAEETIVALLRNSAAYQRTIDRLTDAWGEDKDKAVIHAQGLLDKASKEIDEDAQYKLRSRQWARDQMEEDNDRPVATPRIKSKPR